MDLPLNRNTPLIMHIDLNSCFATIEQQAHVHLRGKPLVVAAYATPNGCVVSPSIEAKRYGIKVGMTVREAKLLCKDVVVRTPDPPMVRDVHIRFRAIFKDYSPEVVPKSIDEAVIDFTGMEQVLKRGLVAIGREIKQRLRAEIGEWISCSIGIATNRFLAKTAASLRKPDGLEVITHENLIDVFNRLQLLDLCGINHRYQARLNAAGIFTPVQFLMAPQEVLRGQVFQSINGYYWYLRLRGWEVDDVEFGRKSYGQQYALGKPTANPEELTKILMKLCEKMGRRLRRAGCSARGVYVACVYQDWTHWHRGRTVERDLFTTMELYRKVLWVFNQQPERKVIAKIGVSCFNLASDQVAQATLFDTQDDAVREKLRRVSVAIDRMNDRYGEFVITPALMMGMDDTVIDRIAFGGVKELEDLYAKQ